MPHPDLASQLDPATLAAVVRTTLDALPTSPDASAEDIAAQREAALLAIAALGPRDPVEAMLAARTTVTHYAIMECFRRAVLPDVEDAMAIRLRNNALSLSRLFTATLRELEQLKARPGRPVPAASETAADDRDRPTSQASAPSTPHPPKPTPDGLEEPRRANIMTELIEPTHGPVPPQLAEAWLMQREAPEGSPSGGSTPRGSPPEGPPPGGPPPDLPQSRPPDAEQRPQA